MFTFLDSASRPGHWRATNAFREAQEEGREDEKTNYLLLMNALCVRVCVNVG